MENSICTWKSADASTVFCGTIYGIVEYLLCNKRSYGIVDNDNIVIMNSVIICDSGGDIIYSIHSFLATEDHPYLFAFRNILFHLLVHIVLIVLMDGDIDIIKSLYLEHIFKGIDYDRLTSDLDKLLWYF